ncbi:MAG: hypothetical protein V1672_05480 [Candidatus Diapherotrites archaeon]
MKKRKLIRKKGSGPPDIRQLDDKTVDWLNKTIKKHTNKFDIKSLLKTEKKGRNDFEANLERMHNKQVEENAGNVARVATKYALDAIGLSVRGDAKTRKEIHAAVNTQWKGIMDCLWADYMRKIVRGKYFL